MVLKEMQEKERLYSSLSRELPGDSVSVLIILQGLGLSFVDMGTLFLRITEDWLNFRDLGCLTGSVGRAHNSLSQDCEYKPHVGHRAYLKKNVGNWSALTKITPDWLIKLLISPCVSFLIYKGGYAIPVIAAVTIYYALKFEWNHCW